MNDIQGQINYDLKPILEESTQKDQTEESDSSKPEDLAPQNGHEKELTEKDSLIQEGRHQANLEMAQVAQNLQDHVHMKMQKTYINPMIKIFNH